MKVDQRKQDEEGMYIRKARWHKILVAIPDNKTARRVDEASKEIQYVEIQSSALAKPFNRLAAQALCPSVPLQMNHQEWYRHHQRNDLRSWGFNSSPLETSYMCSSTSSSPKMSSPDNAISTSNGCGRNASWKVASTGKGWVIPSPSCFTSGAK